MDKNKLAKQVTLAEGLKKSLSIAQVKEVLKVEEKIIKALPEEEKAALLKRRFG